MVSVTLTAYPMPVGEYRVQAVYQNTNRGTIPAPPPNTVATATPIYTDQGVWAQGFIESDEVFFSIVGAGAVAP